MRRPAHIRGTAAGYHVPITTAETILVVDDHAALRDLIEVILCTGGYRVLTAADGTEALRVARNTPHIDLLVADLGMPQMRGEALATLFARLHAATPVLFVSSEERPAGVAQTARFLARPFTVSDLRGAVRAALQSRPASSEATHAA